MTTKSALPWGIGAAVLVAVIALVAVMIAPMLAHQPGPADQFKYPTLWTISKGLEPESGPEPSIEIDENGGASLVNVQLGEIEVTDEGRPCVVVVEGSVTTIGRWEIDQDGALRVHSEAGSMVLTPAAARFGGTDWRDIRELFCDNSYVSFGARSDAW